MSRKTNGFLVIDGLMGTDEFEVRYPYTDQEGVIVFGKGIQSHLDEISKIRQQRGDE